MYLYLSIIVIAQVFRDSIINALPEKNFNESHKYSIISNTILSPQENKSMSHSINHTNEDQHDVKTMSTTFSTTTTLSLRRKGMNAIDYADLDEEFTSTEKPADTYLTTKIRLVLHRLNSVFGMIFGAVITALFTDWWTLSTLSTYQEPEPT